MGVAKNQSCSTTFIKRRTSLYWAIKAEVQSKTDRAVITASNRNRGRVQATVVGKKPYKLVSGINMAKATAKSTSPANTEATGTISLGKYTLVITASCTNML